MTVLVLAERGEQLARCADGLVGERLVAITGSTGSDGSEGSEGSTRSEGSGGSDRPPGYAEVIRVPRYADSTEVELAALQLARQTPLTRIVAAGYAVQLRAACLREYLGVPGQGRLAALRFVDLLTLRAALQDAGVPVVPAGEIRFAADLARQALGLGLPVRLRQRRVAGWPVAHAVSTRAELLALLRGAPDLAGLLVEPALEGERHRVPLDSPLGRAVRRAVGGSAGESADAVTGVHALRLADGRLLVDSVETRETSS